MGDWGGKEAVALFAALALNWLQVISCVFAPAASLTSSHLLFMDSAGASFSKNWRLMGNEKQSILYGLIQALYAMHLGRKQMEEINHTSFVTVVVIELKDFGLWPSWMDFHDSKGWGMTVIKNHYIHNSSWKPFLQAADCTENSLCSKQKQVFSFPF